MVFAAFAFISSFAAFVSAAQVETQNKRSLVKLENARYLVACLVGMVVAWGVVCLALVGVVLCRGRVEANPARPSGCSRQSEPCSEKTVLDRIAHNLRLEG